MRDVPAACFMRIFAASSSFFFCRVVPSRLVPAFYTHTNVSSNHFNNMRTWRKGEGSGGRATDLAGILLLILLASVLSLVPASHFVCLFVFFSCCFSRRGGG